MTEVDARAIMTWRYEEPYALYSLDDSPETVAELLNADSPSFAARDETGELVGFFCFGTLAGIESHPTPALYGPGRRILTVGLGLRPERTGLRAGYGLAFVNAGLELARGRFAPEAFRMYVLTFNERALRVYGRAGFEQVGLRRVRDVHGELEFLVLWRPA